MAEEKSIFAERLRTLRTIIFDCTQVEFAKMLEIPQPTLSAYEVGKINPTIDVLINISKKCKVSVDWLCGNDNMNYIKDMGDIEGFFFELFEIEEFRCVIEIHDRVDVEDPKETNDANRNWIRLMFYHNDEKNNPQYRYSQDVCACIRRAYEFNQELRDYRIYQDRYDSEKEKWIKELKKLPVTKVDHSKLTDEEMLDKKIEMLKAEIAEMEKKKKKAGGKK